MYDDIQDRIWEIEKSWRNNLIFHGIRYDDPSVEEDPNRTEEKIKTVIRVDLQLSRDIPILRAHRIKTGPLVKGTHPILGTSRQKKNPSLVASPLVMDFYSATPAAGNLWVVKT